MSAFWVITYKEVLDESRVTAYAPLASRALKAFGGKVLAAGLPALTYEAGERTRVVLVEFKSVDAAAVRAHDSELYQAALDALHGGAVRHVRVVPGGIVPAAKSTGSRSSRDVVSNVQAEQTARVV